MHMMPDAKPHTSAPWRTAPSEPRVNKRVLQQPHHLYSAHHLLRSALKQNPSAMECDSQPRPKAAIGEVGRHVLCLYVTSGLAKFFTKGLTPNPCTLILESEMFTLHYLRRST